MALRILSVVTIALSWFGEIARADENSPPPITVPDGFVVERAAAPPLVKHPMMAAFDDRGRLFVAESAGMNLRRPELEEQLPNFIRMLEDTDGDGVFDKSVVFADKMTLPMGALWHRDSLYVAAPPYIWRLRDTNGDGVADEREILVSKFGYTGNAASVHGCFLSPCGRIFWCDGRHGHEFEDDGNIVSKGLAARIFSCDPDGGNVEVFAGGGMDNPVEVTFTAEGEMLGTVAIFLSRPQRRDALVHWMYGGAYPHHPCVAEFKQTGDLLPPLSLFGQVAPSGVMRFRDQAFGPEFQDNIFVAQFNTHKVTRTTLERSGSTFRSRDEDFLVSSSIDFHPTDVLQDADGSLLVIDTGGWFRIGCPLSEVAKPEILGGIYRVKKAGAETGDDPRGLQLDWDSLSDDKLTSLTDDARFAVRDQAVDALALRGDDALSAVRSALKNESVRRRRNAVWSASRIDGVDARAVVREALSDDDQSVRHAATKSVGTRRDSAASDRLMEMVVSDAAPVRREAAAALGRIGDAKAVPAILQSLHDPVDRLLEHALIYALIEIDDRESVVPALASGPPNVRKAALIALDQMDHGELTRELVTPLLDTSDPLLQQAALDVISKREGWADEIVQLLGDWLNADSLSEEQSGMLRGALLAFIDQEEIQSLVGKSLEATAPAVRRLVLESIGRSGMNTLPETWLAPLARILQHGDREAKLVAVQALGGFEASPLDDAIRNLASKGETESLRIAAIKALGGRMGRLDSGAFTLLLDRLDPQTPILERLEAAETLSRIRLNSDQLLALAERVAGAESLELPALLESYRGGKDGRVGARLLAELHSAPGLANLPATVLADLLATYPPGVRASAKPLLDRLEENAAIDEARLSALASQLENGDPAVGKELFFGERATCFACHQVGGQGGLVGPDLSRIGEVRSRRDLLEAIVYPSATFARGYESYTVAVDDGSVHTGILARETAQAITLIDSLRQETKIDRKSVEAMVPSKVSIMPQGYDRSLTPKELADLVAYLKGLQ